MYKKLPQNQSIIKPRITTEFSKCITNQDRMHVKLKKEPDNKIFEINYKRYRDFCNNIIKM